MTLWSGRFNEGPAERLWNFTVDHSDRRMLLHDVNGSIAHVRMLGDSEILSASEVETIRAGLEKILEESEASKFEFLPVDEDVHSAVERRLGELIGPLAGKLHTGRSRNDQVCLDLRLYLLDACDRCAVGIQHLCDLLVRKAEEAVEAELIVPAFTHLQEAQAVPFGHHLMAYVWMLQRDGERLVDARKRIAISPLGAGAAGGSSLPLQPFRSADHLELNGVFQNSLDAVASRDFVGEFAFCATQCMVHLSRLSEELILWSTSSFDWVEYGDDYTTGSSALPQKKNPDIAELARGKTASCIGSLTALMSLQKGLPLAYNRDLQEDKTLVFAADDALEGALDALAGMIGSATFRSPKISPWVTALDLAEALVERGRPFREAHEAVGRLVSALIADGRDLSSATFEDLKQADPEFHKSDLSRCSIEDSIARRQTHGGGSFADVRRQISEWCESNAS